MNSKKAKKLRKQLKTMNVGSENAYTRSKVTGEIIVIGPRAVYKGLKRSCKR